MEPAAWRRPIQALAAAVKERAYACGIGLQERALFDWLLPSAQTSDRAKFAWAYRVDDFLDDYMGRFANHHTNGGGNYYAHGIE